MPYDTLYSDKNNEEMGFGKLPVAQRLDGHRSACDRC